MTRVEVSTHYYRLLQTTCVSSYTASVFTDTTHGSVSGEHNDWCVPHHKANSHNIYKRFL